MFLRFLAVRGSCPADLPAAVPRIASWRLAALPRYLESDEIARLLATREPDPAAGARDRAVIALCVRLGLRAGDVRDLRLWDVDWSRGRLRGLGKGRHGRGVAVIRRESGDPPGGRINPSIVAIADHQSALQNDLDRRGWLDSTMPGERNALLVQTMRLSE